MSLMRKRKQWTALLAGGMLLQTVGNCLPEDYFALSGRNIAVAIADGLLAIAVQPLFDALDIAGNDDPPADTTQNTAGGTADTTGTN